MFLNQAKTVPEYLAGLGKSCLHSKSLDDIPVDAVAKLIASHTADEWIAIYKKARA
jgi:hypothetical protein